MKYGTHIVRALLCTPRDDTANNNTIKIRKENKKDDNFVFCILYVVWFKKSHVHIKVILMRYVQTL